MAVYELRSQEAQNDAGVILRGVDRQTMEVEYRGRTLKFTVDRAPNDYGVYLPDEPRWTDGEAVQRAVLIIIKDAIAEILRHWNTEVEFLRG